MLAPVEQYQYQRLSSRLRENIGILKDYERKYGPLSPRLNLLETVVNYALQWVPPFKPGNDRPSPLELICSYSTVNYILYNSTTSSIVSERRLLSCVELGCRWYIFSDGWGSGTLMGIVKPGHIAGGLAIGSSESGFLRNPFRGEPHFGAFFSYGAVKFAWLRYHGESQLMVTRQFQIVPWLF
jgi:hypothetical protein